MKSRRPDDCTLLEQLYQLYDQKMYRLAYSILHDQEQAEDVVQDSFIVLYDKIVKIKEADSARTKRFIMRVVKNKAIDQYWRNRREYGLSEEVKVQSEGQFQDDGKIRNVIYKEMLSNIMEVLLDDFKEMVICRSFYELTVRETADLIGITEAAVRKRHERARQLIQNIIEEDSDEKKGEFELVIKAGR